MRLQVFLSSAGVASRRAAAGIVRSGRVMVNAKRVIEPSCKIDPEKDKVLLDQKRILPRKKLYILLHKPRGVTSTKKDPFAKRTVMDLLPRCYSHLNPVGRLDRDTTGLILLTNDGGLIDKFTHPRYNVEKVYLVAIDKRLSIRDKARLERGVVLDRRHTAPCRIRLKDKTKLEMTLREGRKRQIKRMFSKIAYRVVGLKRIKEGALDLGLLPEGRWRFLTEEEIAELRG